MDSTMGEFNVDKLVQAIGVRKSCRAYMPIAVNKQLLEQVNNDFYAIDLPFQHDIQLADYKAMQNATLYTTFMSPPNGVALVGNTDILSQSKAGFLGELYVLTATAHGLGTCWIGHFKNVELNYLFLRENKNSPVDITQTYGFSNMSKDRVAMCITPIGQPSKSTIMSKVFGMIGGSRKPLIDLMMQGSPRKIFSQDINNILELARRAPSAINCQCWRFCVSQDEKSIKVSTEIGVSHFKWSHLNIDIGICAAHVWLGLLHYGYQATVNITEDSGRAVWEFALDMKGKNYKSECDFEY